MTINEIKNRKSGSLRGFTGTATTTSTMAVDLSGDNVNYSCDGLEVQNLSTTINLTYSFDASTWFEVMPGDRSVIDYSFDALYLKSASSTVKFQGWVIKK